jgi:FecR protein
VVTATGSVTIEHANAVVVRANLPGPGSAGQTKAGDLVYRGDVVQTGADGKVGITFTDGTAFNLSSNARMVLNEFVYDPNGKSNSTLFSLSKGTFTFIAGKVAKTGDMKIDTPVATMGIRGTTPHVEISDDGTVKFSTLIEENKGLAPERRVGVEPNKRVVPVKQRQVRNGSSSDAASTRQAENDLDKKFSINLKICRGC